MEVGSQRHAPAAFTPGKDPVSIVQEVGWAPGPVWIGAENLTPHQRTFPLPLPVDHHLTNDHMFHILGHAVAQLVE
jgi:hypothetical protein